MALQTSRQKAYLDPYKFMAGGNLSKPGALLVISALVTRIRNSCRQ